MIFPCKGKDILFLHPGKTGGTSIEYALRDKYMPRVKLNQAKIERPNIMFGFSKQHKIFLQHADLRFYMDVLKVDLSRFVTICSIRRPYEKVLSSYHYNKRLQKIPFKEFVMKHLGPRINANAKYAVNHFCSQTYYTRYNDYTVDHIIKLENIVEDCKNIGIDLKYHYSKTDAANIYKNYLDAYDDESRNLVYKFYKEDFQLFGYEQ
jgi:hypothetical protein